MPEQAKSKGYGRASADPAGRILEAARTLFFAEGFDQVSVERLVKAAGVSRSTLYKYFGDMPGVLKAVAEREADHFAFDPERVPKNTKDLRHHLEEMGASLLKLIEEREKIQFDRLVFEQARRHPDLAEAYYTAIYERTQAHLAQYIREGQKLGLFRTGVDALLLGDQLLSMWLGLSRTRAVLGLDITPAAAPEVRSREAIATLCDGANAVADR